MRWTFCARPARNGRRLKCFTIDPYSKEVPVIEVDVSIGGARVCRILDRVFLTRPLPETLIVDNVLYTEHKQADANSSPPVPSERPVCRSRQTLPMVFHGW